MISSTQGISAAASAPDGDVRSVIRRSAPDSRRARIAGTVMSRSPIASRRTQRILRARSQASLSLISGTVPPADDVRVIGPAADGIAEDRGDCRGPAVHLAVGPADPRDDVGGGAIGQEGQDLDRAAELLDQTRLGER